LTAQALGNGPPSSKVENVEVQWSMFNVDDAEYFLHKDPATNRSVRKEGSTAVPPQKT